MELLEYVSHRFDDDVKLIITAGLFNLQVESKICFSKRFDLYLRMQQSCFLLANLKNKAIKET